MNNNENMNIFEENVILQLITMNQVTQINPALVYFNTFYNR